MNASQPVQSSPGRPATSSNQTNAADQPSAANASVERLEGGMVHFDATLIRKQRLRQGAADGSSARARSSATAPTTQPVNTTPANGVAVGSALSHTKPPATDSPVEASGSMPTPPASEAPQATDSTAAPSDWWQRVMRDFSDPSTAAPAAVAQETNTEATVPQAAPVQAAATPQTKETPTASPTPPASQATPHALQAFLVNFVVEQTGYPEEIVEMDADLEADLGIDSIKKAQMFGEIGEHYGLQPDDSVSLDDFMTLDHVLQYLLKALSAGESPHAGKSLHEHAPGTNGSSAGQTPIGSVGVPQVEATPAAAAVSPTDSASPSTADLKSFLVDFVVEQTGYPEEIVEMDADLEADLGIDSIKKAQMFGEIGEYFGLRQDENVSLDDFPTLAHVLNYLRANA